MELEAASDSGTENSQSTSSQKDQCVLQEYGVSWAVLFIHSFHTSLLSVNHVPGTTPWIRETKLN